MCLKIINMSLCVFWGFAAFYWHVKVKHKIMIAILIYLKITSLHVDISQTFEQLTIVVNYYSVCTKHLWK